MSAAGAGDPKAFRRALGSFTTGVTVVTTRSPAGVDVGLTANSFNSVSLDPPMVLWSIDRKSSSFDAFMEADHFAVHILAADQEKLSTQFTRKGVDRFADVEFTRGMGDVPLLAGCSARFVCQVSHRYEGGDHVIIVGEVKAFESAEAAPLVFHAGGYGVALKNDAPPPAVSEYGIDWIGFLLRRAYEQMFTPVRRRLKELALDDIHYHLLTTLGMGGGRSAQELEHLMEFIGLRMRDDDLAMLVAFGLLDAKDVGQRRAFSLSAQGQQCVLELHALGVNSEADAFRDIGYVEHQVAKNLLNRLIANTEKNLPESWRKEKVWLQDNVWGAPAPYG